jgi:hypothetical protein
MAADLQEIRRAVSLLLEPGQVYEIRAFGRGTTSGYFDNTESLAQAAASLSGTVDAVYVTANPVLPDLLARRSNRLEEWAKTTTSDTQIVKRNWFLVDFDPRRPAGISSTDEEHKLAIAKAIEARECLRKFGWPKPILADSGNGCHLLYRIDLPNDQASTDLLRGCLNSLAFEFDDELVSVDTGNFNAARIWKLYGTMVGKGDNLPERPHRMARILEAPDNMDLVTLPLLKSLAAWMPKEPARDGIRPSGQNSQFDLESWLIQHQVAIKYQREWNGGAKWVLEACPWNPEHRDKSAFIVQFPSGAIAAGCHHNGCQGLGWRALREALEPGYKDRRDYYASGVGRNGNSSAGYRPDQPASDEEVAARQPLRFLSAAEIAAQTPEEVEWIAKPWVVKGGITEIDGKIKSAGKTTFVCALVEAVLTGRDFLGEPTMRSPVVYLTEQTLTSYRVALRRANLLERKDLIALQYYDSVGTPWNEVVENTFREMKRLGAKLLIVDTLPQFAGLKGESENSSGAALEAIQPLQALAAQGVGVLIVRHDRKAGGDVGDSARGSSAFGGAVDIILSLRRGEGNSPPTVRVIQGIGRFDDIPDKLVIDYRNGEYVSLGTEAQVSHSQGTAAILAVLPEEEAHAMSTDEVLKKVEDTVKPTLAKSILKELFAGQLVHRNGKGKPGSAYRYWRPPVGRSEPPVVATNQPDAEDERAPDNAEKVGWSLYRDVVATDQLFGQVGQLLGVESSGSSSAESRSDGTTHIYTADQLSRDDDEVLEGEL